MRRAVLVLLVLCGCPTPTPPASRFNGVWASTPPDGGAREGILVHDALDGGVVWSPLRLEFLDGGLVLTHRCRDFSVDGATGQVIATAGVMPAGTVTEGSSGVDLVWTAYPSIFGSAYTNLKQSPGVDDGRLRGTMADGSVRFQMDFLTADAAVADMNVRVFSVSRQLTCE